MPPSEIILRLSYLEASLSAPSEWVMIVIRFFATRNRSRHRVVVPESIKMVSPSATSSAARRPMRDLSIWLRPERMGVGTAPEGTVAVTPPYTLVMWPRCSSSFRSRRMVFLDTPKTSHSSSMLTVSREMTYCSIELRRLTFIFTAPTYIIYPPSSIRMYPQCFL